MSLWCDPASGLNMHMKEHSKRNTGEQIPTQSIQYALYAMSDRYAMWDLQ